MIPFVAPRLAVWRGEGKTYGSAGQGLAAPVDLGTEVNEALAAFHPPRLANAVEGFVQLMRGLCGDLYQQVKAARGGVDHLHPGQAAQTGQHGGAGAEFDVHQGGGVKWGAGGLAKTERIACDSAAAFQPLQPGLNCRAGKTEFAGKIGDGLAGIALQSRNQAAISFVDLCCHAVTLPKVSITIGGLPR